MKQISLHSLCYSTYLSRKADNCTDDGTICGVSMALGIPNIIQTQSKNVYKNITGEKNRIVLDSPYKPMIILTKAILMVHL